MADETMLEQRVAAVERSVAELQKRIEGEGVASTKGWLDRVAGSITDEAAFREALEYGRTARKADQPDDPGDGGAQ